MGSPDIPAAPDYDEAARQGVYADLETYPMRYLTEAAAKLGGKVTINGKEYDFTGLGEADNAAVMSDQMAQALLDIQRNFGPEYIAQRIEQLKQADPQGYQARKDLFDKIMASAEAAPDRPMAEELQASIVNELTNAGKLDARQLQQVQQAVRGGQVARGNFLGTAATAQEGAAAVQAGESLRDQQQSQALGFLNSGVTPEDVEYRRLQQSMANLGAFIGGETPQAQFANLSGAGTGAAPFVGGGYNSTTTNPNAGATGINWAQNIYSGQNNWAQQQVNPYMAGISMAAGAGNAVVNLGWQPWQNTAYTTTPRTTSYTGDANVSPWAANIA
jgi:hypothetical protein